MQLISSIQQLYSELGSRIQTESIIPDGLDRVNVYILTALFFATVFWVLVLFSRFANKVFGIISDKLPLYKQWGCAW